MKSLTEIRDELADDFGAQCLSTVFADIHFRAGFDAAVKVLQERDEISGYNILKYDEHREAAEKLADALRSAIATIDYWEEFQDTSKMTVDLDKVRSTYAEYREKYPKEDE